MAEMPPQDFAAARHAFGLAFEPRPAEVHARKDN
jgi:hypothetical protein